MPKDQKVKKLKHDIARDIFALNETVTLEENKNYPLFAIRIILKLY